LTSRRFAGGQRNLAHRAREARHRVHQQHHVLAARARGLGDRGRGVGGAQAQERRLLRGRDHDRGALAGAFKIVFEKLVDFAAALADQRDDDAVGDDVARERAEQRTLADARAGEQTDALAAAEGHEPVDRADAGLDDFADAPARERRRWLGVQRRALGAHERSTTIERLAERVEDASEHGVAARHGRRGGERRHARAGGDRVEPAERHQERRVALEADDLGVDRAARGHAEPARLSQACFGQRRVHDGAVQLDHPSLARNADQRRQVVHGSGLGVDGLHAQRSCSFANAARCSASGRNCSSIEAS
jgi:hypothetical protein